MLKYLQAPQLLRIFSTSQQALPGFMLPVVLCWSDLVREEIWGGGCLPPFPPQISNSEQTAVGSKAQRG